MSDSGQFVLLLIKSPARIPHLEHKYYDWLYMKIQKFSSKITDNQHVIMFRRDLIQNKRG